MEFSTQLRLILLVAGVLALVWMYWLGKRHGMTQANASPNQEHHDHTTVQDFGAPTELDEDELDTPAYLRRGANEGPRQPTPLPTMTVSARQWQDEFAALDTTHDSSSVEQAQNDVGDELLEFETNEFKRSEPRFDAAALTDWQHADDEPTIQEATYNVELPVVTGVVTEPITEPVTVPVVSLDDSVAMTPTAPVPASPDVPVVEHSVSTPATPTSVTPGPKSANPAAKRKIVALRLSVAQRVPGEQLLSLMQRESLQHGRFNIFHRLHQDVSVFSVASMVEPGSFDLGVMRDQQFPGITFFMLLPGPLDGLIAYDQMLTCAQHMATATQGVLQDERGHKLTSLTIDRLREEVLDFQHLLGNLDVIPG